ncbi:hypothetical protein OpiT1DRAFT_03966 [Opitutaceae bacterium TAV1]|nr:hypothetical protein OpiT1DRAFT_03966 [Opitutaceae bacterium TAV1]
MRISPETLQPVPAGTVPSLGAAAGVIVVTGVAAAQLQLYRPGAAEPFLTLAEWTPDPATGSYVATLTLEQIDALLSAGPTLHARLNGGPSFHVRPSGEGDSIPSNPGSGGGGTSPGANYYNKEELDQMFADLKRPAGGQYALEGPNGEHVLYVKRPSDGKLIPALGGGEGNIGAIAAGEPVEIQAQEEN